ncbi:MAG: methionyl-tRNA formyltransferase [Oleiphilaceae bacterium]|nr:methionyl-tRNA formyltransferase [Oleiphilaceae bacterium]
MNIIFAGTPDFAAASLQAIINAGHRVVAVYTQPDRPAGRGKKIIKSPVKLVAESHNIAVEQPLNFKTPESLATLAEYKADVMIVAAYGIILPKAVLDTPKQGCINIHASLLPRWRGAAPIQRAIEAGDTETGVTIMQMDEGLDTGDMLYKVNTPIPPEETGGSLHDRLAQLGADAILAFLDDTQRAHMQAEKQNNDLATYAHKLSKAEAELNWQRSAEELARQVRAFNPWPVSYCRDGDANIRVFEAQVLASSTDKPAGLVLAKTREGVDISCGDGVLRITRLQLPGAKAMSVSDFVNGGKALLEPGTPLSSQA